MSQSSHSVGNVSAPAFRSAMNDSLQALASLNSGPSAPSTTYANMLWYDTANNILKMRSEADDAWINVGYLDQSANAFRVFDDTQVVNTSGTQTGLIGDQATAIWEAGTGTTESLVSPAKVKAAIQALVPPAPTQKFIPTTTYSFSYNPQSGPTTRSSGNITLPAGFYIVTMTISMTFVGAGSEESYTTSYQMVHSKNGSSVVLQSGTVSVGSGSVVRTFAITEQLFEFGGNDFIRTIEPDATDFDHDSTAVTISITAKGPYENATFI